MSIFFDRLSKIANSFYLPYGSTAGLWKFHSEADYFLSRGGEKIPPPMFCNIGLTNKCNLRCEICGSQKFLDETATPRRHMPFSVFEGVAKTLFPYLVQVELNSQGDPLLYPEIDKVFETILRYGCEVKVQTNGTLFTDRIIELLVEQHGVIMLSLDAVGSRFDEVRQGGNWEKAEPQIKKLLRIRQSRQLEIGVYPTVTKRTLPDLLHILRWSEDHGVDEVSFHRYSPIQRSFEEEPSDEELQLAREKIHEWIYKNRPSLRISFEGVALKNGSLLRKRTRYASYRKLFAWKLYHYSHAPWARLTRGLPPMFPIDSNHHGADPTMLCVVPNYYVEVGLEGQIHVCCRAQDIALGNASSVEQFAKVWLGRNYQKIRASLRRDAQSPYPLPNCDPCVKFFVPHQQPIRHALEYKDKLGNFADRLEFADEETILFEGIVKEMGFCYVASLPLGINVKLYELWEGEKRLGPGNSLHDEIRNKGMGRYSFWDRTVYFSSSDNSNVYKSSRVYSLRKKIRMYTGATPPE